MDEYLCLTIRSRPGEAENEFASRLSRFWTTMLRNHQAEFEKVYAETTRCEQDGACLTRSYLVEADVVDLLVREAEAAGLALAEVDRDDTYSRFEASPPEWMQIEH